MRRPLSLILIVTLLAALGGTLLATVGRSEAAEGDPGDYCSQAPDRPLGWLFGGACREHDGCIDALGGGLEHADRVAADLPSRVLCDDLFLEALLESPHVALVGDSTCRAHLICRSLATTYYRVVRFVTDQLSR